MDLLDLAIYILPPYIVVVFLFGIAYRLSQCVLLLKRKPGATRRQRPFASLLAGLVKTFLDPLIIVHRREKETLSGD